VLIFNDNGSGLLTSFAADATPGKVDEAKKGGMYQKEMGELRKR